ncbi:MAG TPA: SDR family NAD(P)-dependent oxidoreductase [Planctomycetota bacterium]|nr:SDR family NAD(P)-dependent oxidoreductase [Planctomycetota bacterium]
MSLAGRCAVVTGAARGIGLAIARRLCDSGMAVALNDVNADGARQAAEELRSKGHRCVPVPGDVTRATDVASMIGRAEAEFGPLWLLVNNAGTYHSAPTVDFPEEAWDREFAVDVKAAFLCSQAALRGMIPRRAGRIVVVSSIAGWIVRTRQIAYCAAKAAAIHFARCLAVETAPHGITVNCVCPGMTDSDMLRKSTEARGATTADYAALIPAGRLATPEDHASTILWLASDEAAHVTGQVLSVDGGQSLYHPLTREG